MNVDYDWEKLGIFRFFLDRYVALDGPCFFHDKVTKSCKDLPVVTEIEGKSCQRFAKLGKKVSFCCAS